MATNLPPPEYDTVFSDLVVGGRALCAEQPTVAMNGADSKDLIWLEWDQFVKALDLKPIPVTFADVADWRLTEMMSVATRAAMRLAKKPQGLNDAFAEWHNAQDKANRWIGGRLMDAATILGRLGIHGAVHPAGDDKPLLD